MSAARKYAADAYLVDAIPETPVEPGFFLLHRGGQPVARVASGKLAKEFAAVPVLIEALSNFRARHHRCRLGTTDTRCADCREADCALAAAGRLP